MIPFEYITQLLRQLLGTGGIDPSSIGSAATAVK